MTTIRALETAAKRSKKYGIVTIGIGNSHHNGALAAYMIRHLLKRGLIIIIKSSVPSSASVAPFGGTEPSSNSKPYGNGFSTTNEEPVIIDISAFYNN